jgi:haloacetate dehalogenase
LADFDPALLAAYRAAWADPAVTRGMCADYRATLDHDFALDSNDVSRILDLPSLILYGADGAMARAYDVPATWKSRLSRITAQGIPGGHFFPDTAPDATAKALIGFLRGV